jgi:hypothetical protein
LASTFSVAVWTSASFHVTFEAGLGAAFDFLRFPAYSPPPRRDRDRKTTMNALIFMEISFLAGPEKVRHRDVADTGLGTRMRLRPVTSCCQISDNCTTPSC